MCGGAGEVTGLCRVESGYSLRGRSALSRMSTSSEHTEETTMRHDLVRGGEVGASEQEGEKEGMACTP